MRTSVKREIMTVLKSKWSARTSLAHTCASVDPGISEDRTEKAVRGKGQPQQRGFEWEWEATKDWRDMGQSSWMLSSPLARADILPSTSITTFRAGLPASWIIVHEFHQLGPHYFLPSWAGLWVLFQVHLLYRRPGISWPLPLFTLLCRCGFGVLPITLECLPTGLIFAAATLTLSTVVQ